MQRTTRPRIIVAAVTTAAAVIAGVVLLTPDDKPQPATVVGLETARVADEAIDRSLIRINPAPSPSDTPSPSVTPKKKTATSKPTTPTTKVTIPNLPVVKDCKKYTGNKLIACQMLPDFGFAYNQMLALEPLWQKESGWNHKSLNESSGAYGVPQALPGSKMASAGDDWKTNPATQIKWGLGYIKGRYGSPQKAWSFWQANHWY